MTSTVICNGFLMVAASSWFYQVVKNVPDPYLVSPAQANLLQDSLEIQALMPAFDAQIVG